MCFETLLFGDAIHIAKQSQIDAARITQKSGNERRAAETALQSFSASLANTRALDAAGSEVNDIAGNVSRIHDAATRGNLNAKIAAAEELGAMTAQAGAAGIGGASVEAYNLTAKLHDHIREAELADTIKAQGYALGQRAGNAIKGAVASMDNNVYRANLDYTQYLDHKKPSFFENLMHVGLTAAATYFGGPQAGMAVNNAFDAAQDIRNGDYAGGSRKIASSVEYGTSAVRTAHMTGGAPSSGANNLTGEQKMPGPVWGEVGHEDGGVFRDGGDGFAFNFNNRPRWGSVTLK